MRIDGLRNRFVLLPLRLFRHRQVVLLVRLRMHDWLRELSVLGGHRLD